MTDSKITENGIEYDVTVDDNGTKQWILNGEYHRIDGPAIEYANDDKQWFQNGVRHRLDGPAVEYANGTKKWYQNDELHRDDGPAIEYANGTKAWYIDGEKLTEEEFNNRDNVSWSHELKEIAEAMNIDVDKVHIKEL